jgi:superfamily I DNA/RNA helicase
MSEEPTPPGGGSSVRTQLGDAVAAVLAAEERSWSESRPSDTEAAGLGDGSGNDDGSPAATPRGRVAVLAPTARVAELRARLLPGAVDGAADGTDPVPEPDLDAPVVVLPVSAAKGLEFDAVVLVEPAELLAESPRGINDLYVALTRATQRLTVVHTAPLPPVLHRLAR